MYGKRRRRIAQVLAIGMLVVMLLSILLSGCTQTSARSTADDAEKEALSVVVTTFPVYDWVCNILGEENDARLTLLLDSGVDMHSFQPTAEDILTISTCDVFLYIGGESDAWVSDALKEAVKEDMVVVNLLEALGDRAVPEETLEGMQEEDHDHEEEEEDEEEYDEHIWLSLKNASAFEGIIADALAEADPAHATQYAESAAEYRDKIDALDKQYEETLSALPRHTLLFGDRYPFRYLADDYGLTCYAAFAGCAAETEASFETIAFLSDKAEELALPCIMTIEGSDARIAETIIRNTKDGNQTILTLNSMQSTTMTDVENGATYLGIMEDNLRVLEEALR